MKIRDLFKKRKQNPVSDEWKNDIGKMILERMANRSPSETFASGTVFDIVRQERGIFERIVRANDPYSVLTFFANAYISYCGNQSEAGTPAYTMNIQNNDTDPRSWNADIFALPNGSVAALCFMPIQNGSVDARIIGIILDNGGDGYYYCMLNKGENVVSDVNRNKGMYGIEKVGEVSGRGFELMDRFLDCMKHDFYS